MRPQKTNYYIQSIHTWKMRELVGCNSLLHVVESFFTAYSGTFPLYESWTFQIMPKIDA